MPATQAQRKQIKIAVIAICLLAAGVVAFLNSGDHSYRSPDITHVWMYDLKKHQLFVAPIADTTLPPIPTADGGEAVKPYIFSCDDCSNESSRFTAYYEKFTDASKALRKVDGKQPVKNERQALSPDQIATLNDGHLISADLKTWVAKSSDDGKQIANSLLKACPGAKATPCYPSAKAIPGG